MEEAVDLERTERNWELKGAELSSILGEQYKGWKKKEFTRGTTLSNQTLSTKGKARIKAGFWGKVLSLVCVMVGSLTGNLELEILRLLGSEIWSLEYRLN